MMMKILLTSVFLLLICAPVGAEPAYEVMCSMVDEKGRPANIATVHMKPDPCLAQMEAAMRAMEPYLSRWHISEDGNMVWKGDELLGNEAMVPLYFSSDPKDPHMKKFYKERETAHIKAQKLWDAAKTACWSKP